MSDREAMLAEARKLGLRGAHLMKDDTLAERLAEARTVTENVMVRVIASSLWWGGIKHPSGAVLAVDDPEPLVMRGQVEIVR